MAAKNSFNVDYKNTNGIALETVPTSGTPDEGKAIDNVEPSTKFFEGIGQKLLKHVDLIVVVIAIVVVLALFQIPIIYYYNPPSSRVVPSTNMSTNMSCASPVLYTEEFCKEELLSQREDCFLEPRTSDLLILSNPDKLFISQIGSLRAFGTSGCVAAGIPFLCLVTLGVCQNGTAYFSTKETCTEISNGVCRMEFQQARTLGFSTPDCSILPEEESSVCFEAGSKNAGKGIETAGSGSTGNGSEFAGSGSIGSLNTSAEDQSTLRSCANLTCRENFHCDNGMCFPSCPEWELYGHAATVAFILSDLIFGIIGTIGGIGVLILFFLRYKKFGFPSSFVIYETIILLIFNLIYLINFVDRGGLYCSSRSFVDSVMNATPYAVIAGAMMFYAILQINIWWVLHAVSLFASVAFPYRFRALKNSSKVTYVHIGCVIAGLIIPIIPVIAPMIDDAIKRGRGEAVIGTLGYIPANSPPLLSYGVDGDVVFFSSILPSIILVEIGVVILILTIWYIHKNHGIFKVKESRRPFSFGTAEKKLLIVFFYYVALEVLGLVGFALSQRNAALLQEELAIYFACESLGHDPKNPCDRSQFERLNFPTTAILALSIVLFAPVVNFVFVVNVRLLKEKFNDLRRFVQTRYTSVGVNSSKNTMSNSESTQRS